LVGHDITVLVKHENHLPVNSFKARNGLSALTALPPDLAAAGVIAASTGNHGQGVAYAGMKLGVPVTICVPLHNNPEKNASIRALGATLIETGDSYDGALAECERLAVERGLTLVHSTNNRDVLAGAGTLTIEMLQQAPETGAMVIAIGGGSQAVGALVVANATKPSLRIYGAQSANAPAQFATWKAGAPVANITSHTFAEGIATRGSYHMTADTLRDGLSDFVTVPDAAIAESMRDLWRITHNMPEGAGAVGFAGLRVLAPHLAGETVGIVISGGNVDTATVVRVLSGQM
jgi:threonine dehydratase